jgi:hypothetical protein
LPWARSKCDLLDSVLSSSSSYPRRKRFLPWLASAGAVKITEYLYYVMCCNKNSISGQAHNIAAIRFQLL